MLVLSRRVGESIVIGDDIKVTVLEVRGDVAVHREELWRELEEANRASASPSDSVIADLSRAVSARRD